MARDHEGGSTSARQRAKERAKAQKKRDGFFNRAGEAASRGKSQRTADGFQPAYDGPAVGNPMATYASAIAKGIAEKAKLAIIERYKTNLGDNWAPDPTKSGLSHVAKYGVGRLRDVAEVARREGISIAEAEQRIENVRGMSSSMKEDYRRRGLYYGTASGEYDPLLKNAWDVQYATSQAEQDRAILGYQGMLRFQEGARVGNRQSLAKKAQSMLDPTAIQQQLQFMQSNGGGDSEMVAFLSALAELASDPSAPITNPEGLIQGQRAFRRITEQSESSGGIFSQGVNAIMDSPGLGHALRAASVPMEELIMQPYYSGSHARDEGGGVGRQVNSTLSGLPGLGFLAGGASKKDRAATDSYEERQALNLKSFGENVTGRDEWWSSGLVDAAFQVVGDPLNVLTVGGAKLSKVGSLADDAAMSALSREAGMGLLRANLSSPHRLRSMMEAAAAKGLDPEMAAIAREAVRQRVADATGSARAAFIEGTRRGRNLTAAAEKAIADGLDTHDLRKAIPGLDQRAAREIAEAASQKEAVEAFKRAFVTGEYNPSITVRRQLLGGLSDKGFNLPGGVGFGPKVVRESEGIFNVVGEMRRASRSTEVRAISRSSGVGEATLNTVQAGLARAGKRFDDLYDDIAPHVMGLSPEERMGHAFEALEASPGLADLFERSFKSTQQVVKKNLNRGDKQVGLARTGKGALEDWGRLVNSPDFEAWLKQMEVLAALRSGNYGTEAAQQVLAEATYSLTRTPQTASALAKEAAANTGTALPVTGGLGLEPAAGKVYLQARIETLIPDSQAQEALLKELERVAGFKNPKVGLGKFERKVEALIKDQGAEFTRLLKNQTELDGITEAGLDSVGVLRRLVNQPLRLVNSIMEPISPAKVAFLGFENDALAVAKRVESFDRYFAALGLDDFTRSTLRRSAEGVTDEHQMYLLVDEVLRLKAAREGVPENLMSAILKAGQVQVKNKQATFVAKVEDGTFEVADEVYTLAQKGEVVYLPDPDDIRRTIREVKALQGNIPARIRKGIGAVPDLSIFGLKGVVTGDDLTIRNLLLKVHRKWKYITVVPGLELAALGAVVGYATAEGDTGDRLKQAAAGASIGLLTPLRYVMRVAGIEEGLRKYLAEGYNPEVWVPHIGRFKTAFGPDLPFRPFNAVKAGDPVATEAQRLLEVVHDGWDALEPTRNPVKRLLRRDSRYVDSYGRIINYQAHPESDAVAEMFLRRQAGEATDAETLAEFTRFVKTDSGKTWMARHRSAFKGATTPEEAFARHDTWYRHYFGDPEIARARLDNARSWADDGVKRDVDPGIIKAAQRRNSLPEVIHAENRFRVPKNFKEVALFRDRLTSKFAFEGPTTMLNRAPMAKAVYRERYNDLIASGVPRLRAQEIAEQEAVDVTNRIMFRIDDESRFAAKADIVFPFQQPREELLRVWAPLIARNKVRTMHIGRLAAVAFNNGKENGTFQQDAYGEWRMVVPGSAFLSKTLFGSSASFDFRLQDLVFFGQGAYGINVIPSPGGPIFGPLARMVINRWPDGFDNLQDWQQEWLFPYGATGRLFRPEVSRLWQAWLGEPAPFEFASRVEQEDALEKHRRFMFLQLKWQHAQKTGDWLWEPSEAELDSAVSASLKAWAFVGAFAPATPGLLRPDQKALDAVKGQFIAENGTFDYYAFIDQYPMWEPWLIAGTDTVDDSFERWAETALASGDVLGDAYDENSTTTHRRRQKKFTEWKQELDERQRESAAYKERGDIQHAPGHLQQKLYEAWDLKYPDLAMRSHDNYNRDIELMHIEGTLIGASKDAALDSWRKRYDVSPANYARLKSEIARQTLRAKFDPWDMARPGEVIFDEVQRTIKGMNYKQDFLHEYEAELKATAQLPVAEQVKYWQWRLNHMTYNATPEEVLAQYKAIKGHVSNLWQTPPMRISFGMYSEKHGPAYDVADQVQADNYREQISEAYAQAYELDDQVKALQAKGVYYGSTISALKARRKTFFDLALSLKNEWYKGIPDSEGLIEDLKATLIFTARGRTDLIAEMKKYRAETGFFLLSKEQDDYLDMNSEVRQAYVDDLIGSLNIDPTAFQKGKLFWEWLTEFQQDLLMANLPKDQVEKWQREHPATSGSGRSSGGYRRYGGGGGSGNAELDYAYEMFRKYNQRGGLKAPAAYKEYLALPNDAVLRTAFLRQHPEVSAYISKGPMANMPPSLAMIVADIMIRNGKWDGEARSMAEISEIGFAREMMERWNRRGNRQAPAAMQLWVDMPTGQAKAQYLKDHPEIGEWLQLGPMANMPEAYREVVRDIMFRYGMWTDSQDPLGKTIQGYYSTPSYLKDKYLEEHPELVEYWKATRSPEQARYYELADTYYGLTDPNSKRAFLSMHPELQQFFLDQRQKRYENFLNRVAVYMGSNPELFTKYLERQEDVLSEMLHKFSEMPMLRERYIIRDTTTEDRRAAA